MIFEQKLQDLIKEKSRPSQRDEILSENSITVARAASNAFNEMCVKIREGYDALLSGARKFRE